MSGVGSTEPPESGAPASPAREREYLERALVMLGRDLDVPEAPDAVAAVRARLARPSRGWRLVPSRRVALVLALVLLALLGATLAVPDARSALFRVLHIGGERIELVEELPDVATGQPGLGLQLGEVVTLEEARRRASFELRELRAEPEPDRVFLGPRGTVWFLWGTPEQVRLLVAQTPRYGIDENFVLKKLAGSDTRVEPVSVDGGPGYFLSGRAHFVVLLDELGNPVEETAWLARNVLVWEDDGLAIRLEGDFTLDRALELADDLR
jgi:hypothetical protein